jgi:hypothetical protein
MAKFMLIKIGLMAEITDAGALRDAALKHFDTADMTSDDYPDTADWHASEEGQQDRRLIATQDKTALDHLVDSAKVCGLLDGVPGARALCMRETVDELEGTTRPEALRVFLRHGHPETAGEDTGPLDEFVAALDQDITNRMASGPVPPRRGGSVTRMRACLGAHPKTVTRLIANAVADRVCPAGQIGPQRQTSTQAPAD